MSNRPELRPARRSGRSPCSTPQPASPTTDSHMLEAGPSTKKRAQINVACNPCRTRKSKCSGERPECSVCTSRGLACQYDTDGYTTRTATLKRQQSELRTGMRDLSQLLDLLRDRPAVEAQLILGHIRSGETPDAILNFIDAGGLTEEAQSQPPGQDFEDFEGAPRFDSPWDDSQYRQFPGQSSRFVPPSTLPFNEDPQAVDPLGYLDFHLLPAQFQVDATNHGMHPGMASYRRTGQETEETADGMENLGMTGAGGVDATSPNLPNTP